MHVVRETSLSRRGLCVETRILPSTRYTATLSPAEVYEMLLQGTVDSISTHVVDVVSLCDDCCYHMWYGYDD